MLFAVTITCCSEVSPVAAPFAAADCLKTVVCKGGRSAG
jgi:hypothetical protein